jgi:hypothetical protein
MHSSMLFAGSVPALGRKLNPAPVQRKMPRQGWDDEQIKFLMRDLALMDSNNFVDNVGVGEREGRVYSRS